jgi:hypothetical protein
VFVCLPHVMNRQLLNRFAWNMSLHSNAG